VLLANISLQAPVVDFVSATRKHETAKASMENMCVCYREQLLFVKVKLQAPFCETAVFEE
jgi:hypothetical protein